MLYFRFPFGEEYFTTDSNSDKHTLSFVSFDETEKMNFSGNVQKISIEKIEREKIHISDVQTQKLKEFTEESKEEYLEKLSAVINFIKDNHLSKLVLSRRKLVKYNSLPEGKNIILTDTFLTLCKKYPNAFVYLFSKDNKCWIGAFSEVLGKFNKINGEFETMSLAGTLPINEKWTEKEINEQQPVGNYIRKILKNYSENVGESKTYDHISGNIKHLRTDFKAQIHCEKLDQIIAELHPTPAVCGIPKDTCKKAIAEFEQHSRGFYSGYIRIETQDSIHYYVNLRCAEFFENAAIIYVGGGITAESIPEQEWKETELKAQSILANLIIA